MSPPVIIYSPDEIRARIISETLKKAGIVSALFTSHFELNDALAGRRAPHVVIVDVKNNIEGELPFLETLALRLPQTAFIVQSHRSHRTALQSLSTANAILAFDPIDPAFILDEVETVLIERRRFSLRKYARHVKAFFTGAGRLLARAALIILTLLVGLTGGYLYWCVATLPDIELLKDYAPYEASKLYTHDNQLLTEFYVERRTFVPFNTIPTHVMEAFIAVEDARFYRHHGIDMIRIISAFLTNVRRGAIVQGGSTITQQLAKMLFLKPERTITRKIKEVALSLQLEHSFTKKEILVLYLNHAYFGERAYGVEAASQVYFGKPVSDLIIAEGALLAALPKAPSIYSPFENRDRAQKRRNHVLKRMVAAHFISDKTYQQMIRLDLPDKAHRRNFNAPYFVDFCRADLEKHYGDRLYTSGLTIYSTLDYGMQQRAEEAVARGMQRLKQRGATDVQAALIALDLKTGKIKAMVGGTDFADSQFNRVTQAQRQPGSVFKPIVYLAALKRGFTPDDTLQDSKTVFMWNKGGNVWAPGNYRDIYHGTVTLTKALALSLNSATLNLARKVGIRSIIKTAKDLGITSTIHPFYSSALGASELTLMEMAYVYAAFAHGNRLVPTCIERIIDREEATLLEPWRKKRQVINKKDLQNMQSMLRAVVLGGTGKRALTLKRRVYGKTGTTNDSADAWFIGFDDTTLAGVWVGRDGRLPIFDGATGASVALPIWIDFMRGGSS